MTAIKSKKTNQKSVGDRTPSALTPSLKKERCQYVSFGSLRITFEPTRNILSAQLSKL